MKFIWEVGDIKPGRQVTQNGAPANTWIIGYINACRDEQRYVLVSVVDGLVTVPKSREELANSLTGGGYRPLECGGAKP